MILAFLIWSAVAAVFAAIGLSCRRTDQPAGFFSNIKPPSVRDLRAYNNAVSALWLISAAVFELLGIPFLFLEQNSLLFLPVILGVVFWMIAMIIAYLRIEARYKK